MHQKTDRAIDGVVLNPSLRRRMLYPQQSMATVVLGRIHALMMASNFWWRDRRQVKDKCPKFPLDINKDSCFMRKLNQLHFRLLKQLFPHLCPYPPTPTNHHKKSYNEQINMKYDIALRHNCDQSATVWWSTRSSA